MPQSNPIPTGLYWTVAWRSAALTARPPHGRLRAPRLGPPPLRPGECALFSASRRFNGREFSGSAGPMSSDACRRTHVVDRGNRDGRGGVWKSSSIMRHAPFSNGMGRPDPGVKEPGLWAEVAWSISFQSRTPLETPAQDPVRLHRGADYWPLFPKNAHFAWRVGGWAVVDDGRQTKSAHYLCVALSFPRWWREV